MSATKKHDLLRSLKEREKELNCLYNVDELINQDYDNPAQFLKEVLKVLPPGWQYPEFCEACIKYKEEEYATPGYKKTKWAQSSPIKVNDRIGGELTVVYTEEAPEADEGVFLKEERKLIETITTRLGRKLQRMETHEQPAKRLIESLQEREKELNCIYRIEELISQPDIPLEEIFKGVVKVIPDGWQYTDICHSRIIYDKKQYHTENFEETPWSLLADIKVENRVVGSVGVFYTKEMPPAFEGPFLREERKLINTIAERLGNTIYHHILTSAYREWRTAKQDLAEHRKEEWQIAMDLLQKTDPKLFNRVSRKMLNHLCWTGSEEAIRILESFSQDRRDTEEMLLGEENRPMKRHTIDDSTALSNRIFHIAVEHLGAKEVLNLIQKWMKEDKSSFLTTTLVNLDTTIKEIADAVRRFHHIAPSGIEFSPAQRKSVRVALVRRFFTEQLQFINVAKDYAEVGKFHDLLQHMIFPAESHGKLGGKSAGLFLASQILSKSSEQVDVLKNIKIPKTWYIVSDGILDFMHYNNLEEVIEQKYKDIDQVRLEYPYIIQVFKNSQFPPDLAKGLYVALDDFGESPLIVRSSSLLEDRLGAAFSGKYKSLFLANQGSKQERLNDLMDAIAEVYASTFSPDPIEYRAERGLLDFHEEMGIMIQEVIGTRVGDYFLPSFAGVAFSNNEFRWSHRIKREDGLIRVVPGLGTRAVDRIGDDYPILVTPGQPGLRVNVSPEEVIKYSPKRIDVINLKNKAFETIDLTDLLHAYGDMYPGINKLVSLYDQGYIRQPSGLGVDFDRDSFVITFEGLIKNTPFVSQIKAMLDVLREKLNSPVDIEFVSDGKDFYLLQCRPQSYGSEDIAVPIPSDIPDERIIFTANHYVSNGKVPDITHIVYVDPFKYNDLSNLNDLNAVGRAVSRLNKLLPKRQFILMGPGRWGSRGDIKLGVNVTYSDINNTAVLIEIARKKGNYLPDLSFGTHFFQDLVEASIRYLPLYPDDHGIKFNEKFLHQSPNILKDILPEFAHLEETVRVIDVPKSTNGKVLQVLMNADEDEAMALLAERTSKPVLPALQPIKRAEITFTDSKPTEDHWQWRLHFAEIIAAQVDAGKYGVKAVYLFGSTKNATASPNSDIDMIFHFVGNKDQRDELLSWLDGWSKCLSEMNFLRYGFKIDDMLDVHLVTDDDIARKTSFAAKIGAITDAARPLQMKKQDVD